MKAGAPMTTQDVAGFCTLCRSRCGTRNTVRDGQLVKVAAWPAHPTGHAICAKGRAAPEIVHSARRLTQPLRRTNPKGTADPGWVPIEWDDALDEIAARLGDLKARFGAESVAFGVTSPSGTPLSDSIDWIERFIRLFGSPNTAYATEICNWHKDHAHAFTFGCGMPNPDYAGSDCIVLWGHNPANVWLAQADAISQARKRGAKLVVIDPRRTAHARDADHWLRVRPGTDGALALGLTHLLLAEGGIDEDFVRSWTNAPLLVRTDTGRLLRHRDLDPAAGGEAMVFDGVLRQALPYDPALQNGGHDATRFVLRGSVQVGPYQCRPVLGLLEQACASYTPATVAGITSVPEQQIRDLAKTLRTARRIGYHAWSGIGQHANAVQTERAIAVLYALTGCFDAPGGNVVMNRQPVNQVAPMSLLPPDQRGKALGIERRPLGPPSQGWVTAHDLYGAILERKPYPVRALMTFGANLLISHAETQRADQALREVGFHVHCDLFETPTARYADILLPVNSPWEREGLRAGFEITPDAEEWIQLRPAMVPAVAQSRSDMRIVFDLALRLGLGKHFFGGDTEAAWNHVLKPLGISVAQLRAKPDGVRHPIAQSHRKYADAGANGLRGFATESKRVEIYSEKLLRHGYPPLPHYVDPLAAQPAGSQTYPYVLTSAKSGYFCHSQHRGIASLRRRAPEPLAAISLQLATRRGIASGDMVEIKTRAGTARFQVRIDEFLDDAVVVADYGWWQPCSEVGRPGYDPLDPAGSNFNALIDAAVIDPVSGSVPHRSFPCDIERVVIPSVQGWSGYRSFQVVSRDNETDDILTLCVKAEDGLPVPAFVPGQHVTLRADLSPVAEVARSYSLCGSAREASEGIYRVAIKRVATAQGGGGGLSSALHAGIAVGDAVGLKAPDGVFLVPVESDFPVVLIAAGVGITPFLGYLERLADLHRTPEVTLYYGNRDGAHHAFRQRLKALAQALPSLRIVDVYSQPAASDRAADSFQLEGRVTAQTVDAGLIARRARFYMCGPPDMMRGLAIGLALRGVPPFEIFQEVFRSPAASGALPAMLIGRSFKLRFARSGREIIWTGAAGTILDCAESNGLQIASGCRVGQCESCAVPVISGDVQALAPSENVEPGTCLTCQSVPATDLVLDA